MIRTPSRETAVFQSGPAWACCQPCGVHLLTIEYDGVITQDSFHQLDWLTLPHRLAHGAILERMDRAMTPIQMPMPPVQLRHTWPAELPVSVAIVRHDQFAMAQEFCYQLGLIGVVRVPFCQENEPLALALLDRLGAYPASAGIC